MILYCIVCCKYNYFICLHVIKNKKESIIDWRILIIVIFINQNDGHLIVKYNIF